VSGPNLLITTDVVGGVWDFSIALASALHCRVTLLVIGEPTLEQRQRAKESDVELLSAPLKLEWMQDAEADVARTRELVADVVRQTRADVLHANQFAAACADVDVPVVLTLHSDVLSWRRWTLGAVDDVPPDWLAYAALVREALARAERVVSISHFLAGEVRSLYTCGRAIDVIHNGWPAALDSQQKEPLTLLAGRAWDDAKNIPLAIEAARGWDPGDVFLAGDQRHPDTGGTAPLAPPLRPLGLVARADMDAWLGRAAVYLSPARYDPFGLLPLQAALRGCALLLSDIPSYRELWDGAACFFRSNDATDLRRQWRGLLADPVQRAELGQRARARAQERYSIDAMANAYRGVYTGVARRRAAA
jgi:glycosyltransferase involved in cell wall biosynthesis